MALLGLASSRVDVLAFVLGYRRVHCRSSFIYFIHSSIQEMSVEHSTSRSDRKFEYSVAPGRGTCSRTSTKWDLDIEFQAERELCKWTVLRLEVLAAEETQKARVVRVSRRACPGGAAGVGRVQFWCSLTDSWGMALRRWKEPF